MMMNTDVKVSEYSSVTPHSYNSGVLNCGIGYVVLSRNSNRKEYIDSCYKNNYLTIVTDRSEILTDCIVEKEVWRNIQFPVSYKERGSCVVWINIPIYNRNVIIGVLNKKDQHNQNAENVFSNSMQTELNFSSVDTDGDKGRVLISSKSVGEEGGVFMDIINSDVAGLLKAYIQGSMDVMAENSINLKGRKLMQLWCGDENDKDCGDLFEMSEQCVKIVDRNGNGFFLQEDGIMLEDKSDNQIMSTDDGIEIIRGDISVEIKKEKGIYCYVKKEDKIYLLDKDNEKNKTEAVLYKPLNELLKDILDKMNGICQQLSTLKVVSPLGGSPMPVFPDNIVLIQNLNTEILQLNTEIEKIKSKTVELT